MISSLVTNCQAAQIGFHVHRMPHSIAERTWNSTETTLISAIVQALQNLATYREA